MRGCQWQPRIIAELCRYWCEQNHSVQKVAAALLLSGPAEVV